MVAVNGGGCGMYRAAATRRCGWGQVAEEKAVWIVDEACVLHPLHMAALSWSAMGHIPCDTCVTWPVYLFTQLPTSSVQCCVPACHT